MRQEVPSHKIAKELVLFIKGTCGEWSTFKENPERFSQGECLHRGFPNHESW
jgi:hypothetical protein